MYIMYTDICFLKELALASYFTDSSNTWSTRVTYCMTHAEDTNCHTAIFPLRHKSSQHREGRESHDAEVYGRRRTSVLLIYFEDAETFTVQMFIPDDVIVIAHYFTLKGLHNPIFYPKAKITEETFLFLSSLRSNDPPGLSCLF